MVKHYKLKYDNIISTHIINFNASHNHNTKVVNCYYVRSITLIWNILLVIITVKQLNSNLFIKKNIIRVNSIQSI